MGRDWKRISGFFSRRKKTLVSPPHPSQLVSIYFCFVFAPLQRTKRIGCFCLFPWYWKDCVFFCCWAPDIFLQKTRKREKKLKTTGYPLDGVCFVSLFFFLPSCLWIVYLDHLSTSLSLSLSCRLFFFFNLRHDGKLPYALSYLGLLSFSSTSLSRKEQSGRLPAGWSRRLCILFLLSRRVCIVKEWQVPLECTLFSLFLWASWYCRLFSSRCLPLACRRLKIEKMFVDVE